MRSVLKDLKWKIKVSVYNQNIRNLIRLTGRHVVPKDGARLLDVGCNDGIYTRKYCDSLGIDFENAYGVDYNNDGVKLLPTDRFFCHDIDSPVPLPYHDNFFDLVIMNQVLEHTKNIGHIISEVNRICRNSGIFAVSVPNLAALHSRGLLLVGKMPLSIKGMDAHVRGFTINALSEYVGRFGFRYLDRTGGGMYPFTGAFTGALGRVFPQFSVFFTLLFRKTEDFDASKLQTKHFHETRLDV